MSLRTLRWWHNVERYGILTLGFLWALPTTLLGIVWFFAIGGWPTRSILPAAVWVWRPRWGRAMRYYGGPKPPWAATTLGHVQLWSPQMLALPQCVRHEREHTKQAWRWGFLFLPVYLWQYEQQKRKYKNLTDAYGYQLAYYAIPFERAAYACEYTADEWGPGGVVTPGLVPYPQTLQLPGVTT